MQMWKERADSYLNETIQLRSENEHLRTEGDQLKDQVLDFA